MRKMAVNTYRKLNFACDESGELLPGALSLPTLRKMIDSGEILGTRLGEKYFVYVDDDNELIDSDPLVRHVMAG